MNRTSIAILLFAVALLLIVWAAWGGFNTTPTDPAGQSSTGAPGSKNKARPGTEKRANGQPGRQRGRRSSMVITAPVTRGKANDRLVAVGNGNALASVSVVPLSNGVLTDVLVSSGAQVNSGDILARMDSEAEVIARDHAAQAVVDARNTAARMRSLLKTQTTSQAQVDSAQTQVQNASLALRDAELKLTRRQIVAPISGIVGIVLVERGDFVTTQTEIATIDDRSGIIIDFWVPERFAAQVKINQTVQATAFAAPGVAFTGVVDAVSSRVEPESRTLRVRAKIDNNKDLLRPGMSFSVQMRFPGDTYPAFDPLAIQWDSNGSYTWVVKEGKAHRVPVRIIQRNPENVLVEAELAEEDRVVVQGVLALREGASVQEAGLPAADRAGRQSTNNQ